MTELRVRTIIASSWHITSSLHHNYIIIIASPLEISQIILHHLEKAPINMYISYKHFAHCSYLFTILFHLIIFLTSRQCQVTLGIIYICSARLTDLQYLKGGLHLKPPKMEHMVCCCHNLLPLSFVQILLIPTCSLLCVL